MNFTLGAVDRWLKDSTKGTGRRYDWERKYYALESRVHRARQTLETLLPAMNRLEAEQMRTAFVHLGRRVDEAIRQLDDHITGEIDEAERARVATVLAEVGVMDDEPPVEVTESHHSGVTREWWWGGLKSSRAGV